MNSLLLACLSVETIFSDILLLKEGIEFINLGNSSHPGIVY